MKEFFEKWTRAIAPFAPHFAEEIWHRIGGTGFVVNEKIPEADERMMRPELEMHEEAIGKIIEDVEKISALTGIKPKKATVFIAGEWKRKAYAIAKEEKNFEKAMKRCMDGAELKAMGAGVAKFLKQVGKNIFALPEIMDSEGETEALSGAKEFMEGQLGFEIEIIQEKDATHEKAKNAMPGKPAIVLE